MINIVLFLSFDSSSELKNCFMVPVLCHQGLSSSIVCFEMFRVDCSYELKVFFSLFVSFGIQVGNSSIVEGLYTVRVHSYDDRIVTDCLKMSTSLEVCLSSVEVDNMIFCFQP